MTVRHAAAVAAALAAGALPLAGCNILGPAYYLVAGQPKKPAVYELAPRPTLVFVDDRLNAIPFDSSQIRRTIADHVSTTLMEKEILTETFSPYDAMALARQHDREGDPMSIDQLGRAVGAEQVIYVKMTAFRGSADGFSPRPMAGCEIKVIDVVNRARLFPPPGADSPWYSVEVESPPVGLERYSTASQRRELQTMLALLLADRVGKLFYRYVPDEIGSRLNSR